MLGRINRWAKLRSKVNGFGGAWEEKAIIVRRATLVPCGHRFGYLGGGRVELRRGADQAYGSSPTAVFADRGNGWKRGLPVQSTEGGGVKTISCPAEDTRPERVEFLTSGCVRKNKVAAVGENRKDGAEDQLSVAPGGEAFASCTELSDCSKRGFRYPQLSQEMNRGMSSRGEPIVQPPHNL